MSYVLYVLLLLFNLKVTCDLDQFTTISHSICCYVLLSVPMRIPFQSMVKANVMDLCPYNRERWGKRVHWYVLWWSPFLPYYFLYKRCLFIISNAFPLLYLWQDDGYVGRPGSTPVSTVLRKSVRFFIRNLFLIIRTFQVEIWKMVWTNVFFFQFLGIWCPSPPPPPPPQWIRNPGKRTLGS